jgi:hypothetical protein
MSGKYVGKAKVTMNFITKSVTRDKAMGDIKILSKQQYYYWILL